MSNRESPQQIDGGYVDGEVNVWYRREPPPLDGASGRWHRFDTDQEATAYFRDDGHEIVIVETNAAAMQYDRELRRVIPIASALQGKVVFHGSSVHFGEGVVLFTGASGAGKSTLAAALQAKGLDRLSDDLVPVRYRDGRVVVPLVGFEGADAEDTPASLPLLAVCFLDRSSTLPQIETQPLSKPEALRMLCFNSYADLHARNNWRVQFEVIADVIQQASAFKLTVPDDMGSLLGHAENLITQVFPLWSSLHGRASAPEKR